MLPNIAGKEDTIEISNEENHLLLLKQIPSIDSLKENKTIDQSNETVIYRGRESTIRLLDSPLRSSSMLNLSKIKSRVASKSHTASPQLKNILNLDAKNNKTKIMELNDRLLDIEKQSENIQKAMYRQLKRIDRQSNKLEHFYSKKYREFQLKIDKIPANLLKNSTHERYNSNKRQEFKNNLSKKLLNAILD